MSRVNWFIAIAWLLFSWHLLANKEYDGYGDQPGYYDGEGSFHPNDSAASPGVYNEVDDNGQAYRPGYGYKNPPANEAEDPNQPPMTCEDHGYFC